MNGGIILFLIAMPLLVSCQANYIRDVQGGSVAPSASTTISGTREGANKRGNSSRLTQSFHFFMFEPIFSPVNALNQPI